MKAEMGRILDSEGREVGTIYILTGPESHPDGLYMGAGKPNIMPHELIALCHADETVKAKAGYLAPCNHKECSPGTTLWDHILHHASKAEVTENEMFRAVGSPAAILGKAVINPKE